MGVEETDEAVLPPPNVGKDASSLAPCHLELKKKLYVLAYGISISKVGL